MNDPETLAPVPAAEPLSRAHVREDALVHDFLAGRRPTTWRTYSIALRDFQRFVEAPTLAHAARTLLDAGHGDANRLAHAWAATLRQRGLAAATVGVRLAALRSLVHLARVQELVSWRLEVRSPRAERYRDTRGPGRVGVRALLDVVAEGEGLVAVRDRALVRLLVDLALRRAEIVALDVEDVDLAAATLAVLGKGREGKLKITLPDPTKAALVAWVAVLGDAPGPLFVGLSRGRARGRLTGTSLARIVRGLGDAAGIPNLHPHALRHSAITQALEVTRGDIRAVQKFSRHADPRTLLIYDDCREDRAGDVARQVASWR